MAEDSLSALEEVVQVHGDVVDSGVHAEDLDGLMNRVRSLTKDAERSALGLDEEKPPTKREKEGIEIIRKLWEGSDLNVDDEATVYFRNKSAEDGGEGMGVAKILSDDEVLLAVSFIADKEKLAKYFPDTSLNGWMPAERSVPKIEIVGNAALKADLKDTDHAPYFRRELCSMSVRRSLVGGDKLEVVVFRNPVFESDGETYSVVEPRRPLPGAGYSRELSGPQGKKELDYWNEKPLWIVAKREWLRR